MTDTQKNFTAVMPLVISNTSQLVKVESFSNSSTTFRPARAGDSLWQYVASDGSYNFYGKDADAQAKPYLGVFNEFAARQVAGDLGINFQPLSILNTAQGWKIGTLFNFDFTVTLQQSGTATLSISEEDKLTNFISHVLLADRNGNAGSVLVHSNGHDISRIDFEQCWGCVGDVYNTDVLTSLGSINPGPFYGEIKNGLSLEKIKNTAVFQKIQSIELDKFLIHLQEQTDTLSESFPAGREELYRAKEHVFNCLKYRKDNLELIITDQLSRG